MQRQLMWVKNVYMPISTYDAYEGIIIFMSNWGYTPSEGLEELFRATKFLSYSSLELLLCVCT